MKMRKLLLVTVAALAASSPVYAQNVSVEVQTGYDVPTFDGTAGAVPGVSYGATLAVEMPIDESIFFGAEVSVDKSTSDECSGAATAVSPLVCVSTGRDFGAGVRFGADIGENSSFYAMAGYTNLRVGVVADDGTGPASAGANLDGIKLGLGFRQWFGKRAYGKVEYRYSNYEGGLDRHQGLVGIGYQF
jgi:outer membrane immunogenic protein